MPYTYTWPLTFLAWCQHFNTEWRGLNQFYMSNPHLLLTWSGHASVLRVSKVSILAYSRVSSVATLKEKNCIKIKWKIKIVYTFQICQILELKESCDMLWSLTTHSECEYIVCLIHYRYIYLMEKQFFDLIIRKQRIYHIDYHVWEIQR